MSQAVILVVEDDADLRAALCDTLALAGYKAQTASDGLAAMEILQCQSIDMVITDIQMPGMDGHELLKKIKTQWPDIPVMLMTAYGSIQMAVEAMRDGAVDYLSKPFEAEVLAAMVNQYVGERDADISNMIAEDPRSRELVTLAKRVADSDATIMLMGESGVGKEVLAHYIHNHSQRVGKPFVAINCAAIPENMLEATLFGYEKGAFTGAYKACPGKFELAQGGTLLLDEISEMDAALQAKLLRVLQEREVERLGGQKTTTLDVRVLATSNRNMRQEVKEGRFREDLFYRLNVFPIQIPALRDRAEDILPLCNMLIRKHLKSNAGKLSELSKSAREKLLSHQWPGNVRELDNVIQRSLILKQGNVIDAVDIQFENISADTPDVTDDSEDSSRTLGSEMKDHEYNKILAALRADNGNRQRAAERLGISQRTLRYKLARMREMGMSVPGRYGMEAV
ncbi:MAG: sigma-54 dependent transcriptional regulator [Gammaproteobacteria bacterium]|nr:sigma-54 dependent transcriptional regulator [Gammaproteobacteria bacterium]MCF6261218.1 sigma-54 dependent transcriptional regulator [Gammaproteobacteria bacterium]